MPEELPSKPLNCPLPRGCLKSPKLHIQKKAAQTKGLHRSGFLKSCCCKIPAFSRPALTFFFRDWRITVVFSGFSEIIKSMNGIFSNVNSPMTAPPPARAHPAPNLWQLPPSFCSQMTRMTTSPTVTENRWSSWSQSRRLRSVVFAFYHSMGGSRILCSRSHPESCARANSNRFRSFPVGITMSAADVGPSVETRPKQGLLRPVLGFLEGGRNPKDDIPWADRGLLPKLAEGTVLNSQHLNLGLV